MRFIQDSPTVGGRVVQLYEYKVVCAYVLGIKIFQQLDENVATKYTCWDHTTCQHDCMLQLF